MGVRRWRPRPTRPCRSGRGGCARWRAARRGGPSDRAGYAERDHRVGLDRLRGAPSSERSSPTSAPSVVSADAEPERRQPRAARSARTGRSTSRRRPHPTIEVDAHDHEHRRGAVPAAGDAVVDLLEQLGRDPRLGERAPRGDPRGFGEVVDHLLPRRGRVPRRTPTAACSPRSARACRRAGRARWSRRRPACRRTRGTRVARRRRRRTEARREVTYRRLLADEREGVHVHDPEGRVPHPVDHLRRVHRAEPHLDERDHPLERDLGLGVVELVEVHVARVALGGVLVRRDHRKAGDAGFDDVVDVHEVAPVAQRLRLVRRWAG